MVDFPVFHVIPDDKSERLGLVKENAGIFGIQFSKGCGSARVAPRILETPEGQVRGKRSARQQQAGSESTRNEATVHLNTDDFIQFFAVTDQEVKIFVKHLGTLEVWYSQKNRLQRVALN